MLKGHLSAEAQRFLCHEKPAPSGRSEATLADLRSATKAYITPAVRQVLATTKVTTRHIIINDVECLEVRPPKTTVSWPILYGFGGGFIQGSAYEDLTIAAPLCAMTGAALIIPSYRLAPEHPWPAAIDDGFSVYQALCERPFACVGESAGGNLVLAAMLRAKRAGFSLPRAVALLSPWCDLDMSSDSQIFNDGRDPSLKIQESKTAARLYAGDHDITNPDISPINGSYDSAFPPCLITTGTRDLLLSLSVRLSRCLRESGVEVDLQVWEGLWHVFEWHHRIPEAQQSMRNIAAFLKGHLTP